MRLQSFTKCLHYDERVLSGSSTASCGLLRPIIHNFILIVLGIVLVLILDNKFTAIIDDGEEYLPIRILFPLLVELGEDFEFPKVHLVIF